MSACIERLTRNQRIGKEEKAVGDIDKFIADALAPETLPVEGQPWTIDTYKKAEWAIATVDHANTMIAKIEAAKQEAIRRFEESAELAEAPYKRSIDTLKMYLEPFARKELEGGKRKSMVLAGKMLCFRTTPDGLKITDERAAIEWRKYIVPMLSRLRKVYLKTLSRSILTNVENLLTGWI